MRQALSGVIAVMGIWLIASPWILHTGLGIGQIAAMVGGLLLLILGIAGCAQKKMYFAPGDYAVIVISVILFVIGIIGFLFDADGCTRASEILCSVVAALVAWIGAHLPKETRTTKVYSKQGQLLVEIKKMVANENGIGAKSVLMGAMPQTVYFPPGELYVLLAQVPLPILGAVLKEILLTPPAKAEAEKK